MRCITIVGTRPEIIRLSVIIRKLDEVLGKDHILVHTGQNYDVNLSKIFFDELSLRTPDYFLCAEGTLGEQIAIIIEKTEELVLKEHPDKALILGDTNSGLSSIILERLGVPVYHMEAGNRCYNNECPEEINRHIIDSIASYNFPYTKNSNNNLIIENIRNGTVTGNPIYEVMNYYANKIDASTILSRLKLSAKHYFLATLHRAEVVNNKDKLLLVLNALNKLGKLYKLPVILSLHPRTKDKIDKFGINMAALPNITYHVPFGFFDFVSLEMNAFLVLSDSGTVLEECNILHVPVIILRDYTERPECVWNGGAIIAKIGNDSIFESVIRMLNKPTSWIIPEEYLYLGVSGGMVKCLMAKQS